MGLVRRIALAMGMICAPFAASADDPIKLAVTDFKIATPLTAAPGDAAAGRRVVTTRTLGNCLSCHKIPDLAKEEFHGEIGPSLEGVGSRWEPAQLRLILANAKIMFPDTMMLAFHRNDGLARVRPEFEGKPILTAQQVEDVVAYLTTMK